MTTIWISPWSEASELPLDSPTLCLKHRFSLLEDIRADDPEAVPHIQPTSPELRVSWRHWLSPTVFCIERRDDDSLWRREMCFKTEFRAFVNARTKSMATLGSYRVVDDFDNQVVAEVDGQELTKNKRERISRQWIESRVSVLAWYCVTPIIRQTLAFEWFCLWQCCDNKNASHNVWVKVKKALTFFDSVHCQWTLTQESDDGAASSSTRMGFQRWAGSPWSGCSFELLDAAVHFGGSGWADLLDGKDSNVCGYADGLLNPSSLKTKSWRPLGRFFVRIQLSL